MSRMSRDKGQRIERELVELHRQLGLRAERVPLSGASRYAHRANRTPDLQVVMPLKPSLDGGPSPKRKEG